MNSSRVFTGILFALFVVTLLMAILAGTNVYRGLHRASELASDQRLSLTLLANDVRANDQIDAVGIAWVSPQGANLSLASDKNRGINSVETSTTAAAQSVLQGPALVLRETLPSGVYETRIYRFDDTIMEEYALADAPYDPEKATAIVTSSVFDFAYVDGLLSITTDAGTTMVALRSAGGEA